MSEQICLKCKQDWCCGRCCINNGMQQSISTKDVEIARLRKVLGEISDVALRNPHLDAIYVYNICRIALAAPELEDRSSQNERNEKIETVPGVTL